MHRRSYPNYYWWNITNKEREPFNIHLEGQSLLQWHHTRQETLSEALASEITEVTTGYKSHNLMGRVHRQIELR